VRMVSVMSRLRTGLTIGLIALSGLACAGQTFVDGLPIGDRVEGDARFTEFALAALDGWSDSVPSRRHATTAAFGFNAPKSRAPQAVLVAVPPDISQRLDAAGLLEVILETRELVQARAPRQIVEPTLPHTTSTAFVSARAPRNFLDGWRA